MTRPVFDMQGGIRATFIAEASHQLLCDCVSQGISVRLARGMGPTDKTEESGFAAVRVAVIMDLDERPSLARNPAREPLWTPERVLVQGDGFGLAAI
jgi:hypothetical protein